MGDQGNPSAEGNTLDRRFTYHPPPSKEVITAHNGARHVLHQASVYLAERVPPCRELVLAIEKIEEAMFWANAGIARNHDHYRDDSG